ncbi:hypothetical protein CRYUN_Cryun04dG0129700 [Craigia yunnanensis]
MGEEVSVAEMEIAMNPHFLLVHGISGGAWCLQNQVPHGELWLRGFHASISKVLGLISYANSILSFDDYNKPLMDFMSALPNT